MLVGRAGMDARVAEISRKRQAEVVKDLPPTAAWEPAEGEYRPPVSPDKPRDLQEDPDVEKGKRLRQFRERIRRLEYSHGELVHSLNPSHFAGDDCDPSILPTGQQEIPGPSEMVGVPDEPEVSKAHMEARRDPGEHLPGSPQQMHSPDPCSAPEPHHFDHPGTARQSPLPASSKYFFPGDPVTASGEFTTKTPGS